ncbi:unnamed protein product, partial [Staurois parvus]
CYDPPGGASGCQLTDLLRAWGLSPGCAFTRAPDGGDGLETVLGQVTTSEQAHQWLRRPWGQVPGEPDKKRMAAPLSRVVTDRGPVRGKRGTESVGEE